MCLDWNSCQEKTQPPHAGLGSYANIHILSLVCYCSFTFLSDAVRWISFEILPSRSETSNCRFFMFSFWQTWTSKQQMSTYSPLMATRILTWKSNLAQWSSGCIDVWAVQWLASFFSMWIFCKSTTFFYHPNSGRSFSQSIFSSKKTCPTVQQFQGQKVRVRFLEENYQKDTFNGNLCSTP